MTETVVSPIERWWPYLEIRFKHEILRDLDAALSEPALAAVALLCGETSNLRAAELSDAEKNYIRTQIEFVD